MSIDIVESIRNEVINNNYKLTPRLRRRIIRKGCNHSDGGRSVDNRYYVTRIDESDAHAVDVIIYYKKGKGYSVGCCWTAI